MNHPQTNLAIHTRTVLLPENRVEITLTNLSNLLIGTPLDVLMIIPDAEAKPRQPLLAFLASIPAQQCFKTAEEVDEYLKYERDA